MGEEVFPTECPCGRTHPAKGKKAIKPSLEASRSLPGKLHKAVADAVFDGKGDRLSNGIWELSLERNCERPVRILRHSFGEPYTQVAYNVRCRACGPCLNARRAFWALSAMAHHQRAVDAGLRTWFGSLTLTPARQQQLLERALYLDAEDNVFAWLPRFLSGHPETGIKEVPFSATEGVLQNQASDYWFDFADLLMYGDQFHNKGTITPVNHFLALPDASMNKRFATAADVQDFFKADATNFVRSDGIVSTTIASTVRETT